MYRNRMLALFSGLIVISLLLGACAGAATPATEAPAGTDQEPGTEAPADTPATPTTDRTGAWLDTIVLVEEQNFAAAVNRVIGGDLGAFALALSQPDLQAALAASDETCTADVYGLFYEYTFNPVAFEDGRLNPFSIPAVREAMHWLIDRDYLVTEIMGGNALPRYTAVNPSFPTGAQLADVFKAIEIEYRYNPDRAAEVINTEMTAAGATQENGVWTFNGEPISLHFLIRAEDERLRIGDYLADQLETVGFTVTRQYGPSADLFPLWGGTPPAEGVFHVYTGGWAATAIGRTEDTTLAQYYTDRLLPWPLSQDHVPTDRMLEVSDAILNAEFSNLEERAALITEGLWLSMEDANRVFLLTQLARTGYRCELQMATDLAGGLAGSWLWANTIRYVGEEGGSVTIGSPSIMTQPWNPIAGSNWLYDAMPFRATGEAALVPDPYTGLMLPNRVESADLEVTEGLPVGQSLDWVNVSFTSEIEVPADAWSDWDAETQTFITVGERFPEGATSLIKSTVYYPADLYETLTWHDGSNFSAADVVMSIILTFDRAKEASAIYDESAAGAFAAFMSTFKGVRIASTDPLVIETWTDTYSIDAESSVTTWWPYYGFGPGAWHNLALGISAEANDLLAFSGPKATADGVEHTSFIGGPSLEILTAELAAATEAGSYPYAATLGEYLSDEEVAARYANLAEWFRVRNHYWVGTNVFYVERAFPVEGTLILQRYQAHPDNAARWSQFSAPAISDVTVEGADRVTIGQEATFDVYVDYAGAPYATGDIQAVSYLVVDGTGAVAYSGTGEASADGHWVITLPADATAGLTEGSNSLEVVVVSKLVAIPTAVSFPFITVP